MLNIFKRDFAFYDLFDGMVRHVVSCTQRLHKLVHEFSENRAEAQRIHDEENEADQLTHQVLNRLTRSFLPPIDRDDVHALVGGLDDIIDLVDDVAKRLDLYHVKTIEPSLLKQTELLTQAASAVNDAVRRLRASPLLTDLSPSLAEIHRLESLADDNHHDALAKLFDGSSEPLFVLIWKELHTLIEHAIDACEDVGNILQGIVLKS